MTIAVEAITVEVITVEVITSCADPWGGQLMIAVETIAVEMIAVEAITVETIAVEVIASCADPGGVDQQSLLR